MLSSVKALCLSGMEQKTNQVTIIPPVCITTIFAAGICGMSYAHMPKLHWKYGIRPSGVCWF